MLGSLLLRLSCTRVLATPGQLEWRYVEPSTLSSRHDQRSAAQGSSTSSPRRAYQLYMGSCFMLLGQSRLAHEYSA